MPSHTLTADDLQQLLEAGERWIELVAGQLVRFEPPDELHGNVVYQLSRQLAALMRADAPLAPCFDLALQMPGTPTTVRSPAVCFFPSAQRFTFSDQLVTSQRPEWILEVASTNDRRESMSSRLHDYRSWQVPHVWVIDTLTRHLHCHTLSTSRSYLELETVAGCEPLTQWTFQVQDLLQPPAWAQKPMAALNEHPPTRSKAE